MRVRSGRDASGDSPRAVGRVERRGPRVGGRGMQVLREDGGQARASVRALALPRKKTC
jgi:hypothetical protein